MDLDAEMPEVQCCEHASIGARRQNHRHRLAEKAHMGRGPALRAAAQLEQALAGGDPGAVIHGVSPFDDDDSAAAQSLQHVNAAVGCEWIGERCAVGAAPSIDKYDDVGSQVILVVEHIAAQTWIDRERVFERSAQVGCAAIDLGRGGEAAQLRCEYDMRHAVMMHRARSESR